MKAIFCREPCKHPITPVKLDPESTSSFEKKDVSQINRVPPDIPDEASKEKSLLFEPHNEYTKDALMSSFLVKVK